MPRDESWFDHLGECLELERRAQRERLEADRASLTLGELEARGHLLLDLEAADEELGLGGRILITFERGDRQPLPARFFPGD
ncbi:MAG TPA: AAA family ATPase, partial [Myxococcaceae bacterium]|nr:AAA family ATPase [Myxococcaceae bacterium]